MTDTKQTLICPACGSVMEKIFSKEKNCYIDICLNGCGGMFFDNRELKKFDEEGENIDFILDAIKDKEFIKTDENKKRICPVCDSVMVKNSTDIKGGIEIDECYSCGGKFLDNGELVKFRAQYATEQERKEKFNAAFNRKFQDAVNKDIRNRK